MVSQSAHVGADLAELPLQHLRDALANGETGLRDERERERAAVVLADAVAIAVTPSGLVEQRFRLRRIERVLRHVVCVRP